MNESTSSSNPSKLSARELRAAERDSMHNSVIWESTQAALVGGTVSILGSLAAQRYVPLYRNLSFPFKTFIVLSAITGTFFTVADRAVMDVDRKFAQKFSVSSASSEVDSQFHPINTEYGRLKDWLIEKRFHVVGYGWATMAGATLLYQWKRRDIRPSQKIINARLSSQVLALVGVAALAALTTTLPDKEKVDQHFESIVNGSNSEKS